MDRRFAPRAWAALVLVVTAVPRLSAQQPPEAPRPPVPGPPISPRSAFLQSLLIPGLAQAKLDRGIAGGIFVTVEALSVAMVAKSVRDLRHARRFANDSVFLGYDSLGTPRLAPSPLAARVTPRKQHLEDWIALLIFNHLFSAADGFVAALLWDVPARVSLTGDTRGLRLSATINW